MKEMAASDMILFATVPMDSSDTMLLQFSLDSEFEAQALPKHDVVTEYQHCLAVLFVCFQFVLSGLVRISSY